ncbi:MAG: hypothetical protein Q8P15_04180 [Nanoarchaeota archaeon]|nr:hypothetical protein [Nanoarchaeota archaeon]
MNKCKIPVSDLVLNAKGKGLVRLVLEENYLSFRLSHPFVKYLNHENIIFYFKGDGADIDSDYEIDLRKIEIIY